MSEDRESRWPLVIGMLYAILLHVMLWPLIGWGVSGKPRQVDKHLAEVVHEEQVTELNKVNVGRQTSSTPQVSWISYDDLRELMAPESVTEQPAQQSDVNPVKDAPLVMDATEAAASAEASEQTPTGEIVEQQPEDAELARQQYELEKNPLVDDVEVTVTDSGEQTSEKTKKAEQIATGAQSDSPANPSVMRRDANPTSAPRTQAESDAAQFRKFSAILRPGQTLTFGDIEVRTRRPDFSVQAQMTSLRTVPNPVVLVMFDQSGKVVDVSFKQRSGAPNVDRPVKTSLYNWRATGKGLKKQKFVILEVRMILQRNG